MYLIVLTILLFTTEAIEIQEIDSCSFIASTSAPEGIIFRLTQNIIHDQGASPCLDLHAPHSEIDGMFLKYKNICVFLFHFILNLFET